MFTPTTQCGMPPAALAEAEPGGAEPVQEADILREQLEYLIEHAAWSVQCGCSACRRYLRTRSLLLEIFAEPQAAAVAELRGRIPKAA